MSQQPHTFPYKTDGFRVNCVDIFLPLTRPSKALQIILYFHGGGLTVGNRKSWFPRWMYDRAMKAEYAFISADYVLLAPCTGHDLLADIKSLFHYLNNCVNSDLASVVPGVTLDASRLLVAGTSAGGLCAYLSALHATPKPKGVLTLYAQGGNFLSWQYLSVKTEPFFLAREMLDPDDFKTFLYPFPIESQPTSDSPLAYHSPDHPSTPGMPANLRMKLCRLYLQLGVFLDYYTGQCDPSLSSQLRSILENHDGNPETLTKSIHAVIPERHILLFPQLLVNSAFPPTFLLHGELDSAVRLEESSNIANLLSLHGVKNTLRIVKGEEHSFDYAEGAQARHAAAFDEAFRFVENILGHTSCLHSYQAVETLRG